MKVKHLTSQTDKRSATAGNCMSEKRGHITKWGVRYENNSLGHWLAPLITQLPKLHKLGPKW